MAERETLIYLTDNEQKGCQNKLAKKYNFPMNRGND